MVGIKGAGMERLKRDLTANQLTLNVAFRGIIETIRSVNGERDKRKISNRLTRLNRTLWAVSLLDPVSGPRWTLQFNPRKRSWFLSTPTVLTCLQTLVECANNQELDRFRECPVCHRWFYAHKKTQQFCGENWFYDGTALVREKRNCRQKMHARSPEFKAKRAEYMRKLRTGQRERQLREAERFRESLQTNRRVM